MTEDNEKGRASETPPRGQSSLSDEVVVETKKAILGIGYKRPPERTRFRKGQSGNPKGRPRFSDLGSGESRSASALVLREAERRLTIREGSETSQIPAIEAVLRAQYVSATRGSAYSQKHILERYDRAERERRAEIMKSNEFWERYVASCREAIAEAERKGAPPPALLPHPDDVVTDRDKDVRIVGPIDGKEVDQLKETCRYRDMLILQDALDQCEAGEPDNEDPLDGPGTALLFATVLNESIPDRFKLSAGEFTRRMSRYECVPKRQLLKDVYRGWRSLGACPPRGKVCPPLRIGKESLTLLFELAQRLRDGRLDINVTLEELEAEIKAIIQEQQAV